jgi:CHASE3 domain sensor protein
MASLGGALVFGTLMVYSFQQAAMYNQNLQEVGEQIVLNSGQ